VLGFTLAFGLTSAAVLAPILLRGGLHTFWRQTFVSQYDRSSPFSIWGLWGGLGIEQHAVQAITLALAALVVFVPRRRTEVTVAALGAAVMICFQLGLTHWFYLYIPWFFPLAIVAIICSFPSEIGRALQSLEESRDRASAVAVGA
jgi:hypothetical protein